jgi:hypothetical protein
MPSGIARHCPLEIAASSRSRGSDERRCCIPTRTQYLGSSLRALSRTRRDHAPGRWTHRAPASCASAMSATWLSRIRLTSRWGGAPNRRLYSRLNCEGLS